MSTVVVQVGQCGNQVGQEFWRIVLKDRRSLEHNVYQNGDGKLRSINIDSEPKVVRQLLKNEGSGSIREENVILGKRGRGTNWALGYHGLRYHSEDHLLEDSLEAVRKEVERCSSFSGFLLLHSISGGTGSGFGSHLTECLRDEYPLGYQLSCVVAPHASGESPLQHYNSLLCLSSLQRFSDAVMLFPNDEVLHRLQQRSRPRGGEGPRVSFAGMNCHIAECLAGVVLPVDTIMPTSGVSIGMEPWEMVRSICPMPNIKFVHVNHTSRTKVSWDNIAGGVMQGLQRYDKYEQLYSSIATLAVARGDKTGSFAKSMKQVEDKIKTVYNCVRWNPYPVDFWIGKDNFLGTKDSSSMTIAANSSNITSLAEQVLTRSREKFAAGAYVHWYWKHGCEQGDFDQAFEILQNIVTDYQEAAR